MNDIALHRPISPLAALRPAVQTWSLVFAMLGGSFVLVTLMVIWVSTPESVSLSPFTPHGVLVRGGQSLAELAPYLRQELLSALELFVGGLIGVVASREPRQELPITDE